MGTEQCRFTLGGAGIGGWLGAVIELIVGDPEGGRLGAATGMAVGGLLGYWVITAIASSD